MHGLVATRSEIGYKSVRGAVTENLYLADTSPNAVIAVSTEAISRAGKRGELYPPKSLREAVGIHPGTKVVFRLAGEKLEVEAIPSLEDVLRMGPITEITFEDFQRSRSQLLDTVVKRR
jgi:hypothetical protein